MGMLLRRASRNRMDCDRNEGRFAESVLRLSGQGVDDWPDGEELTVPCSETCCNLLRRGGTAQRRRRASSLRPRSWLRTGSRSRS